MADHSALLTRIGRVVVRFRWPTVVAWLLAGAAFAPLASRVSRDFVAAPRPHASEAAQVDSISATVFTSQFAQRAILVVSGTPDPATDSGRAALARIVAAIDTVHGVTAQWSFLTSRDSLFRGRGGTFVIVGLDASRWKIDELILRLRGVTSDLVRDIKRSHPQATLRWAGSAPLNHDIRVASAAQGRDAELRVLPLTLLLLLLAFGAIVASLLPLAAATLAIVVALGTAALVNTVWPLSVLLQNIVSMVGLGAGIDYALLTVKRFREARGAGLSSHDAAVEAAEHAGGTIVLSGATVCIGFGALLLMPLQEMRSIGLGGVLVVSAAVLASVTFLPALLAILGHRLEMGRLRAPRPSRNDSAWRSWGEHVVRRPVLVLLLAAVPVAALAWQARRMDARLPRGDWLPRGIESGLAIGDLTRMERGGIVNSLRVLVELPEGASLFTPQGWSAVQRVTDSLLTDGRFARVASVTELIPGNALSPMLLTLIPPVVRYAMISPNARATLIEAVPRESLDYEGVTAALHQLREPTLSRVAGLPGTRVLIGGTPALNEDNEAVIRSRSAAIMAFVVGLTLVALAIAFRSVLIPIKAVALNLVSVGCAYGAVVLVFQDGHGARLMGLDGPMNGVFPAIPILVFCIVFGLSMDYEVFLVARVAEARRTLGEREAIVEGLQRTAGLITSAAAIMIAVFGAFALGSFPFIKILGFALAVAIFVDATVVRLALGPALLAVAGRWNWWPGDADVLARERAR